MWDFLKNIPTKWVTIFVLIGLLSVVVLVGYSVMFQNKPVELWGIKVGESTEDLRKQLQKAQDEIESRVPLEKHNSLLGRLKEAESRNSQRSSEVDNLKIQFKQREDKINQLTKELEETKLALETTNRDLQLSRQEAQKLSAQLNEMKKKDYISPMVKKRLEAFSQQLSELEKQAISLDTQNGWALITSYNNILKSLRKEIPNDTYVQNASELKSEGSIFVLGPSLRTASSQLKYYLERAYLK